MLETVPVHLIEPGDRLRGVSEEQVSSLAASIADVGLLNPITVYRRKVIYRHTSVDGFGLIAGMHRLEACKRLGHESIPVQVLDLNGLERQIAECDENLCASSLSPAERAIFVNRRQEAYEALHGPAKAIGGFASAAAQGREVAAANLAVASFTADTAAKTGSSERTVRREAERGASIEPLALGMVRGTALDTGKFLDELKRIKPENQVGFVERKLDALRAPAPRPVPRPAPVADDDVVEAEVEKFTRLWNKLSPEARDRCLAWLRSDGIHNPLLAAE